MTAPLNRPDGPGVWRWRLSTREVLYVVTGSGVDTLYRPVASACPAPAGGRWERVSHTENRTLALENVALRARVAEAEREFAAQTEASILALGVKVAVHCAALAAPGETRGAWSLVSMFQEHLATHHAADTVEGYAARLGAVHAAACAGAKERATTLASAYAADPRLPDERRAALAAALRR